MSGRGPVRRKTGQSHLITKAEVSTRCPRSWAQRERAGPVPGRGPERAFGGRSARSRVLGRRGRSQGQDGEQCSGH